MCKDYMYKYNTQANKICKKGNYLLTIEKVTKEFGGLKAVNNVSCTVEKGSIVGLIGPNGSGKTTLFNVISGVYKPTAGTITLDGRDISYLSAHKKTMMGLARTFQVVKPFNNISVLENIMVGAYLHHYSNHKAENLAHEILKRLEIQKFSHEYPKNLPLAIKKKVEIARALATSPKILLLDEVMGGLNPLETDQVLETIVKLNQEGTTIVVIEHKMRCIMAIAKKVVVLDSGKLIAMDVPEAVAKNPEVIRAYLGDEYHA